MPDVGMAPPPPPDVAAQMKPSAGPQDLASMIGQFAGQPQASPDIAMQVMQVEPLLNQMAEQAPALAPAADQLLGEMKARMAAPAAMLGAMAGPAMGAPPMGNPVLGGGPPPMGGAPPQMGGPPPMGGAPPMGAPDPMAAQTPGSAGPITLPPPPPTMGLMDIAMQLEVQLPAIGAADPTLLPNIQYFITKMRDEVPKIVSGTPDDQASALSKNNPAPTTDMLKQLPVVA